MKLIIQINGFACVFFGTLMLLPILVDWYSISVFFLSAVLSWVAGAALVFAGSGGRRTIRPREIFLLTTSAWTSAAAAGSLPFVFSGLGVADAFFESMSGITTTGSTVLSGLDQMPRGLLLWRALLQWVGGLGIIVTAIAVLPIVRVGGMQLFRSESSDTTEKELASAAQFASATFWIYLVLTGLCALAYRAGGMSAFDAVTHAMTTVSTGGYSTHDLSLGYFDSAFIDWSATLFMLAGSLPFVWYVRVYTRGTVRSEQVRLYLVGLAVVVAAMTIGLTLIGGLFPGEALRLVAFNVVSVVTTTGFATTDYTKWGELFVTAFFILTFLGGCTGSTAGGIKAMRLIVMAKFVGLQTRRINFPHAVVSSRFEGRQVDREIYSSIVGFLSSFTAAFIVIAIVLNFLGLDVVTSVSGAATALANVGPGLGTTIGPAGNFASLPEAAKWVLSAAMLIGRLEVLTAMILVVPRYWRHW